MQTVYRSPEGKQSMMELYDKMSGKLSFPFESSYVDTRFGKTHLLIGGRETAEPLVIFHWGNSLNPFDLKPFEGLTREYRVYAPDIIGQPGKSDETILSPGNDDYAKWVVDLLENLKIEKACFIGTSVGGGVLMRLAAYAPERICKAVFIVPMGFGFGLPEIWNAVFRLGLPYLSYKKSPGRQSLLRAIVPLFGNENEISEDWLMVLESAYRHVNLSNGAFKSPGKRQLEKFIAPCMLIASAHDILAPAKSIVPKAKQNIPNLGKIRIMENSGHIISDQDKAMIVEEIREFLESKSGS